MADPHVRLLFILSGLLVVLLSGCGTRGLQRTGLPGAWMLVSAQTPDGQTLAAPLGSQIVFGADGELEIESLNDCGGEYAEVGRQLRLDLTGCTQITAPPTEDLVTFLSFFDRTFPYTLSDDVLALTAFGRGARYELVFYPARD